MAVCLIVFGIGMVAVMVFAISLCKAAKRGDEICEKLLAEMLSKEKKGT